MARSDMGVENVKAVAVNQVTRKTYTSVINDGFPYFAALPEGDYEIGLTKTGFKRSSMRRYHDCTLFEEGVYDWTGEMYRGSSKEIVELSPEKVYTAPASSAPEITSVGTRTIYGGLLNERAVTLPPAEYPKQGSMKITGTVEVEVLVGIDGRVVSANATKGHALLRAAAIKAARQAQFKPTLLAGQPVRVSGIITYNFVP